MQKKEVLFYSREATRSAAKSQAQNPPHSTPVGFSCSRDPTDISTRQITSAPKITILIGCSMNNSLGYMGIVCMKLVKRRGTYNDPLCSTLAKLLIKPLGYWIICRHSKVHYVTNLNSQHQKTSCWHVLCHPLVLFAGRSSKLGVFQQTSIITWQAHSESLMERR